VIIILTFRIDVDYNYENRTKSFLSTFLGVKLGKGYLKNAKIIAKMINESEKDVKAYWFFTTKSLPDMELLKILNNSKHEIGLHVVSNVTKEFCELAKVYPYWKIHYFNQHGVRRLLAKFVWHKFTKGLNGSQFPLKYFVEQNCVKFDRLGFYNKEKIDFEKRILHLHPDWLFKGNIMNSRQRFYEDLEEVLGLKLLQTPNSTQCLRVAQG
jgi:hypothetical protein